MLSWKSESELKLNWLSTWSGSCASNGPAILPLATSSQIPIMPPMISWAADDSDG
jgi:hypothetical protein